MKAFRIIFSLSILILTSLNLPGQDISMRLKNQLSLWGGMKFENPPGYQTGGRYIPALSITDNLKKGSIIDLELSVNAYGNLIFSGNQFDTAYKSLKPYRAWLRYSGKRLEIRIGLQKIDFGSATILRPLMWFDKVDYRDPLQLTEGVYGILGRYYFQKNTNIWLWALYGENRMKGWETSPTLEGIPEYGGRFQFPLPGGEMAFSFNHREADYSSYYALIPHEGDTHYPENKIGIDGKWDIGPGIWTEYVLKINDPDNGITKKWENYLNLGIDYTFGIGNGLHVLTEYFRYSNRPTWSGSPSEVTNYSVLELDYPFGLLNRVTAMIYYNWTKNEWYRMLNLERKYDHLSLYLMTFWNSEGFMLFSRSSEFNLFAGTGFQVMAVLNF
jgi:hypothetical protein